MNSADLLVVKIGGGAGLDMTATCDDLARIARDRALVIVHGVSAIMNQLCQDMGVRVESLTSPSGHSSRYTPPEVRDIYVRAAESANHAVVNSLRQRGIDAQGLRGESVAIHGERKRAIRAVVNGRVRIVRDDHSGSINCVDSSKLLTLLDQGKTPVLPPMAASPRRLAQRGWRPGRRRRRERTGRRQLRHSQQRARTVSRTFPMKRVSSAR